MVLALKDLGARYEGKLLDDGNTFEGKWKQGGQELGLKLMRHAKAPIFEKPQNPKKPYPYREEEVSYENKSANLTLAGTLTLPKEGGPFPVVLLITGSGPQDRDETILGHKPFLILADYLTRKGIAVLRVDDRGVGKSTGKFSPATTEDFAGDVMAGVEFLKSHKEIDPRKIGLMGHSEGGIIAPMVAVKSKDVAFIVLLAGTGLPGADITAMQTKFLLKGAGLSEKMLTWSRDLQKRIIEVMHEKIDDAEVASRVKVMVAEELEKLDEKDRKLAEKSKGQLQGQLSKDALRWSRFFLVYDPRPALRKVTVPVLAVNGEKDFQVPPKENLSEIEKALKEGGNKDFTIKEFPNLNHLFQTCKTGNITEYGAIQETIAPVVLEFVAEWIGKRVK
ncbi:MAG: alpha/beta fold hydrolase [Planctomycetes bacterium]|nr:alpha/beta fold hydrolase [Planctomycetota bacterium]